MITLGVSISEHGWADWVDAVADTQSVRSLEMPADLFLGGDRGVTDKLEAVGVKCVFVRELVASEVARNAPELADAPRHELIGNVCARIKTAGDHGIVLGTLDMGNVGERKGVETATGGGGVAEHVRFLRRLMPAAAESGVTVALPMRFPPAYPGAKQGETVGTIVHEVMHPNCKYALDVFPSEVPVDFDLASFLRRCAYQAGVVRFNYEPGLDEGFVAGDDERWARALHRQAFRGGIVFRPRNVESADAKARVCQRLDRWAATFWNVFSSR